MSVPVALPVAVPISSSERINGLAAVGAARLLLIAARNRPDRLARALQLVGRGARSEWSPIARYVAERARKVVEAVSLRCASHHGCLLRSVAVLLLTRWHGYSLTWQIGVHSPPPSSHAWVTFNGQPIGEPFDPLQLYTPIITLTSGRDTPAP